MKLAAVRAIASLAREEPSDVAARAYSGDTPTFGPDYIIPSPFDQRLILRIAPAVARRRRWKPAWQRARSRIWKPHLDRLNRFVFRSGLSYEAGLRGCPHAGAPMRVIYADGEDERVLRAAQVVIEERIAAPILVGRPQVVETRLRRYGLKIPPRHRYSSLSTPKTIRAIATMSIFICPIRAVRASRRKLRAQSVRTNLDRHCSPLP
ncbi:phosphate acyltransferase [Brucella abortus]|nr:phosphate acyltransferase [Brucella abortus]